MVIKNYRTPKPVGKAKTAALQTNFSSLKQTRILSSFYLRHAQNDTDKHVDETCFRVKLYNLIGKFFSAQRSTRERISEKRLRADRFRFRHMHDSLWAVATRYPTSPTEEKYRTRKTRLSTSYPRARVYARWYAIIKYNNSTDGLLLFSRYSDFVKNKKKKRSDTGTCLLNPFTYESVRLNED